MFATTTARKCSIALASRGGSANICKARPLLRQIMNNSKSNSNNNMINTTTSTSASSTTRRQLSTKATIKRHKVSPQERAAIRQARKERATAPPKQSSSSSSTKTATGQPRDPRLVFGLAVAVPTGLIAWGVLDPNSPPAKLATLLGFDDIAESFAKPNNDGLIPHWRDMPVPPDFQPMTLVLDLEDTLVNCTWDRKNGWRTAKRPGAVNFIRELAQYYEIVLYTPSPMGVAIPIVDALQNESGGGFMHTLFREACYYKNGTYMKDLSRLNRNTSRIIMIDDDEKAAALNPENLIKVKPYSDPNDRSDDTLDRLLPFLIEMATQDYKDAKVVLAQFRGMDADEIADELEGRVQRVRNIQNNRGGLSSFANTRKLDLPAPGMTPVDRSRRKAGAGAGGISSKDLVGDGPTSASSSKKKGVSGWLQKRQEQQEKEKMAKMEHWNKIMMERNEEQTKKQQQAS